jgi:pimeloyl-ACP methyl ester carboxylesterase
MRLSILVLASTASTAIAGPPLWETVPLPPAMPAATTSGYVAIADNAQIYYAIHGNGSPVVLLHGGLGNSDHWAFQVPDLAKTHRVIVLDSRNQGRSTFSKTKVTYQTMANDVIAVMDELKLARVAVVGWSDGAAIALELGLRHPKRVSKLFVFATNYDANGSKPRKTGPSPTFTRYAVKCKNDYLAIAKDPKHYNDVVESLTPLWTTRVLFTKDQLRSIKTPTVLADGDHDEIINLEQVEEMAKLIPTAKLVVFKDTSHFAHWQDPAGFTKAVQEFLAWNP